MATIPPVVPGLTQMPESAPENPLMALLGLAQPQSGGPALADLRGGMAALRRAAAADPRIAERIRAALDILEGRDAAAPDAAPTPSRMGDRFNALTPI